MSKRLLTCVLALLAAPGCGRPQEGVTKGPTIPEEKPPTAAAPASPAPPPAALVFQVLQEHSDAGVAATVNRLDDTGAAHFLVDVDDSGIARLPKACEAGDRFEAEPKLEAYLRVAPQPCAPTVTFRLYSAQATYDLLLQADNNEKAGNFAAAHEQFGLAAERLQFSNAAKAGDARMRATAALKSYQLKMKLPATGVIDEKTRGMLAREKAAVH